MSGVIAGNAFLASASGGYFLARMRRTRDAPGSRGDARPPYRRRRGRTRDARNVRASENEKSARTGGPSNGDTRLQSCPGKGQSVDFGRSRESCGTEHRSSREMWSTSRDDKLQPKSGERVWRSRRRAGQVPSSANAMPSRRKYPSKRRSFERTEAIFVTDAHTKRDVEKVTNKQKRPLSFVGLRAARRFRLPPFFLFAFPKLAVKTTPNSDMRRKNGQTLDARR